MTSIKYVNICINIVSNINKDNELAVGTIDGELMIFKGDQKKPWRVCSNLGSVNTFYYT